MSDKAGGKSSPLVAAVQAFDAELRRFAHAADSASRRQLDSRRDLERAAEALKEAMDAEAALEVCARDLLAALNAARDQQQAQSAAVRARADEIHRRAQQYEALMERYRLLGVDMAALIEQAQNIGELKKPEVPSRVDPDTVAVLTELDKRVSDARDAARALRNDAQASSFEEIRREAHGAEQTLSAILNKVLLLKHALGLANRPEA